MLFIKSKEKENKLTVFWQHWCSMYHESVLSTRCGGFQPQGFIVASSYRQEMNKKKKFLFPRIKKIYTQM